MKTPLLIAASLLLPALAFAGGRPKPTPFKPAYDVLASVDTTAKTVTVSHVNSKDTSTKTFNVDVRTEIEVNGKKATLDDAKPGMKVSVTMGMDPTHADRLIVSNAPVDTTAH